MNKTPVSILQEMMAKRGMTPDYELIYDGGGSHVNTFTYRVSCDNLSAHGTGRCKKDAKHEAARAMLEAIAAYRAYPQLPASPAQSPAKVAIPSVSTSLNVPFTNAIGSLQDLCAENNLQEPKYDLIDDVGPPHARRFTIQCTVSTFKEQGIATTKKQAKHEAANKMFTRITELLSSTEKDEMCSIMQSEEHEGNCVLANKIAKARYPELSRLSCGKKNLGLKMSECHIKCLSHIETDIRVDVLKRLTSLMSSDYDPQIASSIDKMMLDLKDTIGLLNLKLHNTFLESTTDVYIAVISIDTSPELVQMGVDSDKIKALYDVILRMIETMIILLS